MKFYGIIYEDGKEKQRVEIEANGYVQAGEKIRGKVSIEESSKLIIYREDDEIPLKPKPEKKEEEVPVKVPEKKEEKPALKPEKKVERRK